LPVIYKSFGQSVSIRNRRVFHTSFSFPKATNDFGERDNSFGNGGEKTSTLILGKTCGVNRRPRERVECSKTPSLVPSWLSLIINLEEKTRLAKFPFSND